MTYGIEIDSGIGTIQILSDSSMSGFKVVESGTGFQIPGVTGYYTDDIVLISYTALNPGEGKYIYIDKNTNPWSIFDEVGASVSVDWVKIRPFSTGGTASTSGYGIQIFNNNGDLLYDSNNAGNFGVSLKDYALTLEFSGDFKSDAGPLTQNLSEYVSTSSIFYSSVFTNTKCGFFFANNVSIGSATYSGIYYTGYFTIYESGFPINSYLPNFSELFSASIGAV